MRIGAALVVTLFPVALGVAADAPPSAGPGGTNVFPAAPERDIVIRACAACHAPEAVVAKRHTADEWDAIIVKMVDRGAVASEEEQQRILEYLVRFFGPA
jgi:hypothetical protein